MHVLNSEVILPQQTLNSTDYEAVLKQGPLAPSSHLISADVVVLVCVAAEQHVNFNFQRGWLLERKKQKADPISKMDFCSFM